MTATTIASELLIDKSAWKPVRLGDVVRESRLVFRNPVEEGLDRVVGLDHLDSESIHLRRWQAYEESTTFTKKFVKGQVLFGRRRAYLKKAALATFDGVCSGDITVLEAKDELLPELLPFLISNDKFFDFAVKNSAGSLSPRAKFRDLATYEFLLPPKDQQARLAELLWAGDEMVEAGIGVLRQLERTRSALRKESFSSYASSPLRIGDFAEKVGSGVTPLGGSKVYQGSGVRFIRSQNVLHGEFDFDDVAYISKEIDSEMSSTRIRANDVLLNITGASIGRCAVYTDTVPANVNQHVCIIRTRPSLDPFFLAEFLNSSFGQQQIDLFQAGGNREGLNFANIRLLRVPNLSLEFQRRLSSMFKSISNQRIALKNQVENARLLQKALINQIF